MALTLGSDMQMVVEGLYIGQQSASENSERLHRLGVTLIVQAVVNVVVRFPDQFKYHLVEVIDDPNADLLRRLPSAVTLIYETMKAGNSVLVFCDDGRSRSAAIIIAYLMYVKRQSYSSAFALLRLKREKVRPNFGFTKQLLLFEKELRLQNDLGNKIGSETTRLVLNGHPSVRALSGVPGKLEYKVFRGLSPGVANLSELAQQVGLQMGI